MLIKKKTNMLMKWEDLEVGDIVKIHPEALKYWRVRKCFVNVIYEIPHPVSGIRISEKTVVISIKFKNSFTEVIRINSKSGIENGFESMGIPFFEIVGLKED